MLRFAWVCTRKKHPLKIIILLCMFSKCNLVHSLKSSLIWNCWCMFSVHGRNSCLHQCKMYIHVNTPCWTDGPDNIKMSHSSVQVKEDGQIVISCSSTLCKPSCTAQWTRSNSTALQSTTNESVSLALFDSSHKIQRDEDGLYTCTIVNTAVTSMTRNGTTRVTVYCK